MSDTVPPKMLMIDGEDEILKHWKKGTDALVIDRKQISATRIISKKDCST